MANPFFEPGARRSIKVAELFARIAPRYDLINDLQSFGLHRYWKRRLIRLAQIRPGERALDSCCGTGDLALALAEAGAEVIGLDFSGPMLAIARRRAALRCPRGTSLSNVSPEEPSPEGSSHSLSFMLGDAQQLPFSDAFFDLVTVGYGLRNLPSWEAGLGEMSRVTKPGGRILALDFGKPDNSVWRALYFSYLRCFVPLLGLVFCGSASAYAYILESLKHYPGQRGVAAKMAALGLTNVQTINFLGGIMSINYGQIAPK